MKKKDRKTFGFNLTASEQAEVQRKAGDISIGQYARRLVLDAQPDAHCDIRRAMGRAILAVHQAVRDGLPDESRSEAVTALEHAFKELRRSSSKHQKRHSIGASQ